MKSIIPYLTLSLLILWSCGGAKKVAETPASGLPANLLAMQQMQLKSYFIDAKSAQLANNIDKAKKLYSGVYEKDNSCYACAYELAKIEAKQSNYKAALDWCDLALLGSPNNPFYQELYAEMQYRVGNYTGAVKSSLKLLDSFPNARINYQNAIFYLRVLDQFEEAENVALRYEQRFGFVYRTFKLYEYIYNNAKDSAKMLNLHQRLSLKYPNNMKVQKDYLLHLFESGNTGLAEQKLNQLQQQRLAVEEFLPERLKLEASKKNWKSYVLLVKELTRSNLTIIEESYPSIIMNEELKDSNIVHSLKELSIRNSKYIKPYQYYNKRLLNQYSNSLESAFLIEWKAGPRTIDLAKRVYLELISKHNWTEAKDATVFLLENEPAMIENYARHALVLMNLGRYEEMRTIAQQGLVYAIQKKESCQLYLLKARASFYLNDPQEVEKSLKEAWVNQNDSIHLMEDLAILSLLTNNFKDKVVTYVQKTKSKAITQLISLMEAKSFDDVKWRKLMNESQSLLIEELAIHQAKKLDQSIKTEYLLKELLKRSPNHTYYKKFNE